MTRSGEDYWEDSWDDSLDDNDYSDLDINDLEDLGDGVYTDGNGNYYIDIDYDGDIDLETIAPGHVEDEMPEDPETPTPDPGGGSEGGDSGEDEDDFPTGGGGNILPEVDTTTVKDKIDAEMVALGREGVEKIKEDLESGEVQVYQCINGVLNGLGVGANANGIITSAANFVKELASDQLFQTFGKSISAVGVACGSLQTFVAFVEGDEFSVGDWMNVVSTTLGVAAILSSSFPIVAGGLGVASGIVGLASVILSENIQPGFYIIEIAEGSRLYLYVGNVTLS